MLEYYDYLPDNNLETKYFNEIIEHLDIDIAVVAKNFGDTVPKVDREKIMLINADEAYSPQRISLGQLSVNNTSNALTIRCA